MVLLLAMSLEMVRREKEGWDKGGGWVHPKDENSTAVSGL